MICPYNQNSHYQVIENIYNEETERTTKTVIKEVWGHVQCLEEDCAVWREGRCRYNE